MTMNEFSSQLALAAVSSMILQWVKNSAWFPWINKNTAGLNRAVAIVISGIGAAGIHMHYDTAAGSLTLTGLTKESIVRNGWTWFTQFAFQHGWYKATNGTTQGEEKQ
jgi:hypothetical protein